MLLAVTSKDEVNLISCLAAKRMGVKFTVARISSPEYYESGSVLSRERLGIDLMINPERESAWETYQLLLSAAATDVAQFADGRVQLVGVRVREGAPVAGKTLDTLQAELEDYHYVTAVIVRGEETLVPDGSSTIETGDQIYLLSPTSEVAAIPPLVGYDDFTLRRVMIAGGSLEGPLPRRGVGGARGGVHRARTESEALDVPRVVGRALVPDARRQARDLHRADPLPSGHVEAPEGGGVATATWSRTAGRRRPRALGGCSLFRPAPGREPRRTRARRDGRPAWPRRPPARPPGT